MKQYVPSYSTGPMYTNFLHELTLKELKFLNAKFYKPKQEEQQKEESVDV
jgi:hypothetical protein